MNYPNPPIQTSTNLQWLRRVVQAGRSHRILNGQGYRVQNSTAGVTLKVSRGQAVSVRPFHVKEIHDDYLICRTWDGITEGVTDIKVAKPNELMNSRTIETLPDGTILNYSSWDNSAQSRHAEGSDGTSEDQFITPRYLIADTVTNSDSVIYAGRMNTLAFDDNGNPIGLGDFNRGGRAYAAQSQ